MNRMAYFGTNGNLGHSLIKIHGNFTKEEIEEFEAIDCIEDFNRLFGGKYSFKFFKYVCHYGCLAFNASPDDRRIGSKTVFFVENAMSEKEVLDALELAPFVKRQFQKLADMYNVKFPTKSDIQ